MITAFSWFAIIKTFGAKEYFIISEQEDSRL